MAKSKRHVSSAQRDKEAIKAAKYLKSIGLISKQAKLHGGQYISRAVLNKVRELDYVYRSDYTAIKVKADVARKAAEQGFTVSRGRVVAPRDRKFQERIRKGAIGGVRPVKGGAVEAVVVPANNLMELLQLIESGELDNYKLPGEQFAFKYYGGMSLKAMRDSADLNNWLTRYKSMRDAAADLRSDKAQEEFENFQLMRLNPSDVGRYIPTPEERRRTRTKTTHRRDRESYAERTQRLYPAKAARMRSKDAERKREEREALKKDPARYADYIARGKARVARSRATKKSKN